MFFFYRVFIDTIPEDFSGIIRECVELYEQWPKPGPYQNDKFLFLFNYDPEWFNGFHSSKFTFYETELVHYRTYDAIGADVHYETENVVVFSYAKGLYVFGHLAYDCDDDDCPPVFLTEMDIQRYDHYHDKPNYHGKLTDEDMAFLQEFINSIKENFVEVVEERNELLPLITAECQKAFLLDLAIANNIILKHPDENGDKSEGFADLVKTLPPLPENGKSNTDWISISDLRVQTGMEDKQIRGYMAPSKKPIKLSHNENGIVFGRITSGRLKGTIWATLPKSGKEKQNETGKFFLVSTISQPTTENTKTE